MKRIFVLLAAICMVAATWAQKKVTGVVVDNTQEPIIGATVLEKGTNNGTITDFDGNFSISVANDNAVLLVSYVGMQSQEVSVKGQTNGFKVILKDDSQQLEEVVIVGFGTQKKINATGAVKTIDNKAMEARPISNAAQGLQGVIGGLNITNDMGGELGTSMEINIRGVGTVGTSSSGSVLVLIDGIEGDLNTINPNDIENISVLKDAASASIYGSRAPFGVILVTTKSGQEEKMNVTYTGNVRMSQPLSVPDMVDSYTYCLMVNDAYTNAGSTAPFSSSHLQKVLNYQAGTLPYGIEATIDNDWSWYQRSFANTDWYDVYLKKLSVSTEHNLSLRGGGKRVSYYLSANYLGQNGLFKYADETYNRLTVNGRMNIKLLDNLQLTYSTRLISTDKDKPTVMNDLFYHNLGRRSPLMPITMPDGTYNKESMILSMLNGGRYVTQNKAFYNSAQLTYEPIKNWKIYADFGSRIETPSEQKQINTITYTLPDGKTEYAQVFEGVTDKSTINATTGAIVRQPPAGTSYYERMKGSINYWNFNFRTDYEWKRDRHYIKALLGMQAEYYNFERIRIGVDNVASEEVPFLPSGAGTNTLMSEKKGDWSTFGVFGRINYNFADRYMVELNLRGDAASRFPADQRWAMFPSYSIGWNLGQEEFWSTMYDKGFEMIKLRASYGSLGNQNTSSFYPYFQSMTTNTGTSVIGGAQTTVINAPTPYATSLTWETVETIDAGIDLGWWSNRFSASFDWFNRTTKDMVGPSITLPAVFGATVPDANNAELRTRGWEVELAWRDRIGKDISYSISATISDNKSVVTKYASADGSLSSYYVGQNIGDIWGYEVAGIAQSDLEMEKWLASNDQSAIGSNWGGGDLMYRDLNGDGQVNTGSNTIYDPGDLKVIGNSAPRYSYSFTLSGSWKFIDLSLFFQGVGKRDLFFNGSATFFGFAREWQRSLYVDHLDYFRFADSKLGGNPDSYYGRLRIDQNNIQMCDRFLQDGSYLRLKNAQIGFSLPKNTKLNKVIQSARLYLSGENLLTFTKLRIYDPESVGSNSSSYGAGKTYPSYRVYSVGLEVTF